MSDEKVYLTVDEALAMLPEGDHIHTFRGGVGMMIGADWDRADVVTAIRETQRRELSGAVASAMGHRLCIAAGGALLFIATDKSAAGEPL